MPVNVEPTDFVKDNYHKVKTFSQGVHARSVELWKNSQNHLAVRKQYKSTHRPIFENEVRQLSRLADCPFVPKLLSVENDSLTIWMTYCGKPIKDRSRYSKTVKKYTDQLRNKWGLYHNDLKTGNICVDEGGQLYFIDLGWTFHKRLLPGYSRGRSGHSEFKYAQRT
jgi:RIO-like serine/threonine protein kinase